MVLVVVKTWLSFHFLYSSKNKMSKLPPLHIFKGIFQILYFKYNNLHFLFCVVHCKMWHNANLVSVRHLFTWSGRSSKRCDISFFFWIWYCKNIIFLFDHVHVVHFLLMILSQILWSTNRLKDWNYIWRVPR